MAKTKNDHHRIFVMIDPHLTKDGQGYVNIRVANRQNRNRTVDIAVYLPSGERFKLKPGQLVDEHYNNGTDEQQRNFINAHLDDLKHKINRYTFDRELVTKKELENVLYGIDFLNQHKKARTKTIEIKITDTVPTALHAFLREDYPKKIEIQKVKSVNDDGFEVIEEKRVVLDPLSLEDFPKNFNPELYRQVKDEVLKNATPEQRKRYESQAGKWFLQQRILFQIQMKYPLLDYPVKEVVKVSNDVIKEYEKRHGKLKVSERGFLAPDENRKLLEIKQQFELKNLNTEQLYKRGQFNKNDIFEIFALTYYDKTITNEFYPKIVIRLFEYKERVNPPAHPKAYNKEWILNFFKWFDVNGYYVINTKSFDPLKYDRRIFFQEKERHQYEGKSLQKMLNIIKDLSRKFAKRGLLPAVDLSDVRLKDFTKKKDRKGTRKEYALSKDQFDALYHHPIRKKDLPRYQELFNEINGTKSRLVTVDKLVTAKRMFICQVMFGGLRGWHDYKTATLKKHSKDAMKVAFHVGKKDDAIENPLNAYTLGVLGETANKIPFIDNEWLYRSLIKAVVRFIDFDKEIKKNKYRNEYLPLSELFQPGFFARKTFGQIMRSIGVDKEDIKLFTGHESEKDELSISYLDENTIENKARLTANLKIGKGS